MGHRLHHRQDHVIGKTSPFQGYSVRRCDLVCSVYGTCFCDDNVQQLKMFNGDGNRPGDNGFAGPLRKVDDHALETRPYRIFQVLSIVLQDDCFASL